MLKIILDLRKAFDCVSHPRLPAKIGTYVTRNPLVPWLPSDASDRPDVVKDNANPVGLFRVAFLVPFYSWYTLTTFKITLHGTPFLFDNDTKIISPFVAGSFDSTVDIY